MKINTQKSINIIAGCLLCLFIMPTTCLAQRTCGTDAYMAQQLSANPKLGLIRSAIEAQTQQWIQNNYSSQNAKKVIITIPVVVHVVYNTASQNISDVQVLSQIDVLNEDYRRLNADTSNTPGAFMGVAADCEIEFCLAQRDPLGNATNGITRTSTTTTSFSNDNVKQTSAGGKDGWPKNDYLNIWVCNLAGGLLGYATPPGGPAWSDGVVVLYTAFGSVGTISPPFNKGRTATHEIGHWVNLAHTFQGGCAGTTSSNCGSAGDLVCDTPPTSTANYGCPATQNTCTETPTDKNDMTMNYMDYTNDACMNLFTTGQKNRMVAAMNGSRLSIQSSMGCVSPVTNAIDAGISVIVSPAGTSCATTIIPVVTIRNFGLNTLTSATINYNVDGGPNNTFPWTGSLATGITQNVTLPGMVVSVGAHTFNSSATNPNGGTDMDITNDTSSIAFTIAAPSGAPLPFIEGFEGVTFPPSGWVLDNPNSNATWSRVTTASGFGSSAACAKMDFYSATEDITGQSDYLYTIDLNLSTASSPTLLDFNLAYARYDSSNYDSLIIWGSTDCGGTWTRVWQNGNLAMATIPDVTTAFTPTASQWSAKSVNLDAFNGAPVFQVRFHAYSLWGNNLYIDDINIHTALSGPPPVANFSANNTTVCVGNTVTFTDLSTNSPTIWSWTFAGGTPGSSTLQNPVIIYNAAGTYSVTLTVTNSGGSDTKTTTSYITVNPSATVIGINASCAGACNGSASLTASGGSIPYSYQWSNTQTTSSIGNLCAGTYSATVTDANGCSGLTSVTISEPAAISLSASGVDAACGASDGSASVIPTNGISPYTYSWNNGQTTSTATGLAAGVYSVTVTDANGCTSSAPVAVNNAGAPTLTSSSQDVSCNGGNNGSASVTATGGVTPYTYSWSDPSNQTDTSATGLIAGNYTIVVTDASGCKSSQFVTVNEPAAVSVSMSSTLVSNDTVCNGTATANVSGGTVPFTYQWNDLLLQTGSTATGLCIGNYSVTVTDDNGCISIFTIYVDSIPLGIAEIHHVTDINIYPVPSTGIVHIDYSGNLDKEISIYIFNTAGSLIYEKNITGNQGGNYSIDLSDYSSGLYYIRVQTLHNVITKKITVINMQ